MNFNLDVRLKQLESLEHYISSSRDKVQSILDCLKWDTKEVMTDTQLIKCSIDPSHRVSVKNVDEHVKKCCLRKEGYELDEPFLSEPLHDLNSSVIIDDHKKIEILSAAHRNIRDFRSGWNGQDPDPKTADRLICTFSPDERAALYSYGVAHSVGPPTLPEFNTIQPPKLTDKPLTYEELRKRERDAKRRRIKHKSVHTNRKNHTEVLREVIAGQMELYSNWLVDNGLVKLKPEHGDSITNEQNVQSEVEHSCDEQQKSRHSSITDFSERATSVISKSSTHSDSSKSTSVRNHKDKHEHNHHKDYDDRDKKNDEKHGDTRDRSPQSRRRSREHHERNKYRRSRSRHGHNNSSRHHNSKVR